METQATSRGNLPEAAPPGPGLCELTSSGLPKLYDPVESWDCLRSGLNHLCQYLSQGQGSLPSLFLPRERILTPIRPSGPGRGSRTSLSCFWDQRNGQGAQWKLTDATAPQLLGQTAHPLQTSAAWSE